MAAITRDAHGKLTEVVLLLNNIAQSDSLVGFATRAAATHGAGRWDPGGETSLAPQLRSALKAIGIDW